MSQTNPYLLNKVESVEVKYLPEMLGFRYTITLEGGEVMYLFVEEGRLSKQMNPENWK